MRDGVQTCALPIYGRRQGLERGHPGLARSLSEEREVPEESAAGRSKFCDLDKPQTEREENSRAAEEGDQKLHPPEELVSLGDPLQELLKKRRRQNAFHSKPTPFQMR